MRLLYGRRNEIRGAVSFFDRIARDAITKLITAGAGGYHENHKNAFDTPYYTDREIAPSVFTPDTLFGSASHAARHTEFTSITVAASGINHENCKSALTYSLPAPSCDVRILH